MTPMRLLILALLAATLGGCANPHPPTWNDVTWNKLGWDRLYYWGGDKYDGQFDRRLNRDGAGTYTFANGDALTGTFKDGYVQSPATLIFADGKRYVGSFHRNHLHGSGVISYPNGDSYEGSFLNGRRHGQGTYYFANGHRYRGEFTNDQLTGYGRLQMSYGDVYIGQIVQGKQHGRGRQTFGNGRTPLECIWEAGAFLWPEKLN